VRSMAICAVDGPATGRHRATPSRPARATRRS
jgi:hypothetical protein